MNIVPKKEAVFAGKGEPDIDRHKLTCYNKATNKLIFIPDFADSGPNWIPAQVNGRKVKAFRLQPVTITNPD